MHEEPLKMERPITAPTLVEDDPLHGKTYEHPAFAQIAANRANGMGGSTTLYGSDFGHHNTIRITLSRSQLRRDLSHDWHFAGKEIITVELSEAQWATFVNSLNVGNGVPCTIDREAGVGEVPGIAREDRKVQFAGEVNHTLDEAVKMLDALQEEVKAGRRGENVRSLFIQIRNRITSSLPFISKSFDQHMEKTVEAAKAEVHGHIQHTLVRAGLSALGADGKPTTLLTFAGEDEEKNNG
jgi:hypothetical protein